MQYLRLIWQKNSRIIASNEKLAIRSILHRQITSVKIISYSIIQISTKTYFTTKPGGIWGPIFEVTGGLWGPTLEGPGGFWGPTIDGPGGLWGPTIEGPGPRHATEGSFGPTEFDSSSESLSEKLISFRELFCYLNNLSNNLNRYSILI